MSPLSSLEICQVPPIEQELLAQFQEHDAAETLQGTAVRNQTAPLQWWTNVLLVLILRVSLEDVNYEFICVPSFLVIQKIYLKQWLIYHYQFFKAENILLLR